MQPASKSTVQDPREAGACSQWEQPDSSSVRKEMEGPASRRCKGEAASHELQEMDTSQRDSEEGVIKDKPEEAPAEKDKTMCAKNNRETGQQEQHGVKSKDNADNTAGLPAGTETLALTLSNCSGQSTQPKGVPEANAKTGSVEREPEREAEALHQDVSSNDAPVKSEKLDEVHSSTVESLSEPAKEILQDNVTGKRVECAELEQAEYPGPTVGQGIEFHASQGTSATSHGEKDEGYNQTVDVTAGEPDHNNVAQSAVSLESGGVQGEPCSGHASLQTTVSGKPAQKDEEPHATPTPEQTAASHHRKESYETAKLALQDTRTEVDGEKATTNPPQQPKSILVDTPPKHKMDQTPRHHSFSTPFNFTSNSPLFRHSTGDVPIHYLTSNDFAPYNTLAPAPPSLLQASIPAYPQPNFDDVFSRQQQLQAQIAEKKRQLEHVRRLQVERAYQAPDAYGYSGFSPNQHSATTPSFLMGPLTYQRAPPQPGYPQPGFGNGPAKYQGGQMQPSVPHGQMPVNSYMAPYPTQGCNMIGMPLPGLRTTAPESTPQQRDDDRMDEDDCEEEMHKRGSSDDDEPLKMRVKRHPSGTSPTVTISKPDSPALALQHQVQHTDTASTPLVSHPPPSTTTPAFDWKLPQYDIQVQPPTPTNDLPSAKISLPGLVREELLLSPDHADQETHLLLNVFLPAQRALATPDPCPAVALLNFHTIAVMVIEAYVQFEIGDEEPGSRIRTHGGNSQHVGGGSGSGSGSSSSSSAGAGSKKTKAKTSHETEYPRTRSARSANPDEIFFAVLDRWRAGLESNKKNLELIRGIQEFCDVALDVIFHVKEHGLLGHEDGDDEEEENAEDAGGECEEGDADADDQGILETHKTTTTTAKPKPTTKAKTQVHGVKRNPTSKQKQSQPSRKKVKLGPDEGTTKKNSGNENGKGNGKGKGKKGKQAGITVVKRK